jgi:membrane carboxypeptidase/penicillin-binding protein
MGIKEDLERLEEALIKDAEASSEGPNSMTKSKFASEMERKSFIEAYGQEAYDNLKD